MVRCFYTNCRCLFLWYTQGSLVRYFTCDLLWCTQELNNLNTQCLKWVTLNIAYCNHPHLIYTITLGTSSIIAMYKPIYLLRMVCHTVHVYKIVFDTLECMMYCLCSIIWGSGRSTTFNHCNSVFKSLWKPHQVMWYSMAILLTIVTEPHPKL